MMMRWVVVVLGLSAALAGAAPEPARVRFACGLLDERAFDFNLGALAAARSLHHGEVSGYRAVAPGRTWTTCWLLPAHTCVWQGTREYAAGWQTVVATGSARDAEAVTVPDDPTPPADGSARFRLVGASTGLPVLAAELSGPRGAWRTGCFGPGEATDYLTVPAGEYRLTLHRATAGAQLGPRLKTVPCLPLGNRGVYSGFTFGRLGGTADWQQMRAVVQLDGPDSF